MIHWNYCLIYQDCSHQLLSNNWHDYSLKMLKYFSSSPIRHSRNSWNSTSPKKSLFQLVGLANWLSSSHPHFLLFPVRSEVKYHLHNGVLLGHPMCNQLSLTRCHIIILNFHNSSYHQEKLLLYVYNIYFFVMHASLNRIWASWEQGFFCFAYHTVPGSL